MFKTGIRNIYRDFCRYVIPNSNAMKCKCFVDRFISANCSMKRLALSGKVIVKLIISGKQFNYWQRHQIFGVLNPTQPGMIWTVNYLGGGGLFDPPCVSR